MIESSVEDTVRDDDLLDALERPDSLADLTDDLVDDFEDLVDVVGVFVPFVVAVEETSRPLSNFNGSIGVASSLKQ